MAGEIIANFSMLMIIEKYERVAEAHRFDPFEHAARQEIVHGQDNVNLILWYGWAMAAVVIRHEAVIPLTVDKYCMPYIILCFMVYTSKYQYNECYT